MARFIFVVVLLLSLMAVPRVAAQGIVVTPTGGGGTVTDVLTVYDVTDHGVLCDNTDRSTELLALLDTVSDAGGGVLFFPPCTDTYRFDEQILIPNDGATPQPNQVTMTFAGSTAAKQWYGSSGTVLDLRYTAVDGNAKIETRGLGTLQITGLTLTDGGSDNATPFVHSTNTTLLIEHTTFIGSGDTGQDAVVLGGTDTSLGGGVDAPFQGYGTSILNNHFRALNRGLYGLNWVNGVNFMFNAFQGNVGTVGVELDSSNDTGQSNHGNQISFNLFEMDVYTYGIKLTDRAQRNVFVGNQFFDPDASATANVYLGNLSTQNRFECGLTETSRPDFAGDTVAIATTTRICNVSGLPNLGGRGDQSSEFAYGAVFKGTYDSADVYPGPLTVSDMFNGNENLSFGVDHSNNRAVIESKNNTSGLDLYLNPVKLGRVFMPDLTVSGDTSTNISIVKGSAQSGDLFKIQYDSVNDFIGFNAGGSLVGQNNAEGIRYQLVAASGAASLRFGADVCMQWNSANNLNSGSIDTTLCRSAANQLRSSGGVQWTTGTRPTCNSTNRGTIWYVAGGAGVLDTMEVCRKDAADAYAWVTIF